MSDDSPDKSLAGQIGETGNLFFLIAVENKSEFQIVFIENGACSRNGFRKVTAAVNKIMGVKVKHQEHKRHFACDHAPGENIGLIVHLSSSFDDKRVFFRRTAASSSRAVENSRNNRGSYPAAFSNIPYCHLIHDLLHYSVQRWTYFCKIRIFFKIQWKKAAEKKQESTTVRVNIALE